MEDREPILSVTKKDFVLEWYSGSGAGGQHRNKHQNCCRIKHPESGAEATGTESRSREQNKDAAFRRLVDSSKFMTWLKRRAAEIMGQGTENIVAELSKRVEDQMKPENLKIEYLDIEA
jgi:protein subunit release factor B